MFHRRRKPAPTVHVGDHLDRLSRIRPAALEYDERQNREDLDYGSTFFTRVPELFLKRRER